MNKKIRENFLLFFYFLTKFLQGFIIFVKKYFYIFFLKKLGTSKSSSGDFGFGVAGITLESVTGFLPNQVFFKIPILDSPEKFLFDSSSNQVATTVIFKFPLYSSFTVAPKIIFASLSIESVIILAASSTSYIDKSVPQVILKSNHFAQAIDNSKSGESIAALAASVALFSPLPKPIPISAEPAFFITEVTSAKSTFIKPG
jgi:hypothetical protein